MVGWYHRLNGREWEAVQDREAWRAAVPGLGHDLMTDDNNNNIVSALSSSYVAPRHAAS